MKSRVIRRTAVPMLAAITVVSLGQQAAATSGDEYSTKDLADAWCTEMGWGTAESTGEDSDADGENEYECTNPPKIDPSFPPDFGVDDLLDRRYGPRPGPTPEPRPPVTQEPERPLPIGGTDKLFGR